MGSALSPSVTEVRTSRHHLGPTGKEEDLVVDRDWTWRGRENGEGLPRDRRLTAPSESGSHNLGKFNYSKSQDH